MYKRSGGNLLPGRDAKVIRRLTPKVGLLPLILELYDQRLPELRGKQQELVAEVSSALAAFSEVTCEGICCRKGEVQSAVSRFEAEGCDAIVVLFTAYAPSLVAADALVGTELPILIFNTQISYALDRSNLLEELLRNHGMHGVQDLAKVLLRRGKQHHIVTGHFSRAEPRQELRDWLRACALRRYLMGSAVGLIGAQFEGMGDFQFDHEELRTVFGTRVEEIGQEELASAMDDVPAGAIEKAIERDRKSFEVDPSLTEEELKLSEGLSLAVLGKLESAGCCGWSMNFLDVGQGGILPTVPFLAASRSLEQGYGYAGEGDALSALGVFVCQQLCPPASFTEMFCMDPKSGSVLLSHMGEANYAMADGRVHLVRKDFAFGDCARPATPVFAFKPGDATLVNLIPAPGGGFRLITARVQMQKWDVNLQLQSPQGYMEPEKALPDFLNEYSAYGGSHHLSLTYGDNAGKIAKFAALCGVQCVSM